MSPSPNTYIRSRSITLRLLPLVAAVALLVAACGGGEDAAGVLGGGEDAGGSGEAGTDDARADADLAAVSGEGESAAGDGGSAGPNLDVDLTAATEGRDIISTATLSITVEDLGPATRQAIQAAERKGGLVFSEDTTRRDGARTTLTLKVPPDQFRPLLADLAELGDLTQQQIDTDDVTETVVDLESRINTAEASVTRLRDLMDRADRVEDVARLETELLNRETTLETLRGQLRTIEQQISLSTVTVTLDAEDDGVVVDDEEDSSLPTFLDGLAAGWDALLVVGSGVLAALGAIAPWLPIALAALLGLRHWRRRTAGPATA